MGCLNSSDKDGNLSEKFCHRVSKREPLALKLKEKHQILTNECRKEIQKPTNKSFTYEVHVNRNVKEANETGLTYDHAKATASEFIGYAMTKLEEENWGGNVHFHLSGRPKSESELVVDGHIEIPVGKSRDTKKKSFKMTFKFFCAEEK